MVRSGCRAESGSNPDRGLHPPLSDPAELSKISHSHKLLWQSSQKSQTVGGITSAYDDTGNHQDLSPKGRMGNLHRLQGRLLPHPHTGTVQEVPEISFPGSNLPVQSTAIRSVDSPHGVHYYSKRGKADGHSERCKDPPIPRRLVGESHIPPGLSPAYTGPSKNVPTFRLAGERRKVRIGTQTSFQLRRLPI